MNDAAPDMADRLIALEHAASDPASTVQWMVLVAAVLCGLVARGLLRRHPTALADRNAAPFPDLAGPVVALLIVLLGERVLFHHLPAPLLQLARPLLVSLCVIRAASHFLRTLLAGRIAAADGWERVVTRVVWLLFALHVLGLLDPLLELLDEVALPIGAHRISVLQVLQGGCLLVASLAFSLWLGRVLERRVMGLQGLDTSLRVIFTKLLRAGLIALAVVLTLPLVGVDITFLSVLGGGLGVGLGFGLQKIASNYVSGFIILLERSVRLNDVVTVDGRRGVVTQMQARYTVLKASDGSETIIPNENFVTSLVVNHTLTERAGSGSFPLWLGHDADVHQVVALLEAMLRAQPEVIAQPAPSVQVNQVTDVGIEVVVNWWIPDLTLADQTFRPRMLLAALDLLRTHGVPLARRPEIRLPGT